MRPFLVALFSIVAASVASGCVIERDRPYCLDQAAVCIAFGTVDYPGGIPEGE